MATLQELTAETNRLLSLSSNTPKFDPTTGQQTTQPVGSTRTFGGQLQYMGKDGNWTINSSALTPSTALSGQITNTDTTTPPYVPPPTDETPPLELTAKEKEQQTLSGRLQELNSSLVGESAFRTEQEKAQGIDELNKIQNDLSSRFKALYNESLAIPLRFQQYAPQSGIAQVFVDQKKTEALRANAIESLGVNALLESSRGNLSYAQSLVDKAVKAKYDPIQEEITAATKNLELIKNDPETSLQDKNRAQKQLDAQNAKQVALDNQKEDQKNIFDIMLEAQKNGASATVLNAIQNAKSGLDAIKIAKENGIQLGNLPASAQEYMFAKAGGYTGSFTDYQNEDANRKKSIAAAGIVHDNGLTTKQTQNFVTITNKFQADSIINQSLKGLSAVAIADQVIADPSKATNQLKSLYVLVKNLDPDSAVREGELALSERAQSLIDKWKTNITRINEGQLIAPETAKELAEATKELAVAWNETARRREAQYKAQAVGADVGSAFNDYLQMSNMSYNGISLPGGNESGSSYNGINLPN